MRSVLFFMGVCIAFLAVGSVNATMVADIQLTLDSPEFYQGGSPGNFHLTSVGISPNNGLLRAEGAATYEYGITGTITVTPSLLTQDNSSGGLAAGEFAGGATLTINGELINRDTSAVLASGDLLVGLMDSPDWTLEEWANQDVRGNTYFSVTGGELLSGVDLGGETLYIGDFQAVFSFITGLGTLLGSDPDVFGTASYSGWISNTLIVAVPEPCTLVLLALGGLLLRKK